MKQHLPNSITLLNLVLGCCAVISILDGEYLPAFWFVLAAVAADFADGLVARLLGVSSEIGKQLDSLADMVSFGVVPGAIYYSLLSTALYDGAYLAEGVQYWALPGFLVTAFSCLRLAKFNLDTRQSDGFIGLPTPSSTMFTVGLMLMYTFDTFGLREWIGHPVFLLSCIVALSYLLVAELPMFSLKIKSFTWRGNEIQFIFAGLTVVLLVLTQEAAFSLVVLLYVLFSIFRHLTKRA